MPCRYRIIGREASVDITSSSSSSSPSSLSTSSSSQSDVSSVSTSSSSHSSASSTSSSSSSVSTSSSSQSDLGPLLAFPGAVGWGKNVTGGRGGDVYVVNSLANSGTGTLRDALTTASGPRVVVFNRGGTIFLQSNLDIFKDNISVMGQTCPVGSGGIIVAGARTELQGNHMICRYMTFASGDYNTTGQSPWTGKGNQNVSAGANRAVLAGGDNKATEVDNIYYDHVTALHGLDQTGPEIWHGRAVTLAHCLQGDALDNPYHGETDHDYGSLHHSEITAGERTAGDKGDTLYCCVYVLNEKRAPAFTTSQVADWKMDHELVAVVSYGNKTINMHTDGGSAASATPWFNVIACVSISREYSNPGSGGSNQSVFYKLSGNAAIVYHGDSCYIDYDNDATFDPVAAADANFASCTIQGTPHDFPLKDFVITDLPGVTDAASLLTYVVNNAGNTLEDNAHQQRIRGYVLNQNGRIKLPSQDHLGKLAFGKWTYGGVGTPATGEWSLDNATTPTVIRVSKTANGANGTITAVTTSQYFETLTVTGHEYWRGMKIRFSTTGTLPAPLATGTDYWIFHVKDANRFTVSASETGPQINLTSSGSGTHTAEPQNDISTALATILSGHRFWIRSSSGGSLECTATDNGTDQGTYREWSVSVQFFNGSPFGASANCEVLGFDRDQVILPDKVEGTDYTKFVIEGGDPGGVVTNGIPDAWKTLKGLAQNVDPWATDLDPLYGNLEVYLHERAEGIWP